MDVRIISLRPRYKHAVKKIFPQATFIEATDMINIVTPQELLDNKVITPNAFNALVNGRKEHIELGSTGAVGLTLSFQKALKSGDINRPILICEDDCVPLRRLPHVIQSIMTKLDNIDMVIFGPLKCMKDNKQIKFELEGFDVLNNYYWGNHAVLFTRRGRSRAIRYLQTPIDVQLDAYFSQVAMQGRFDVLIQSSGRSLARQKPHLSSVQKYDSLYWDSVQKFLSLQKL